MSDTGFFILGNGGCGTSLLRGLLNSHSKITCDFENYTKCRKLDIDAELEIWEECKNKCSSMLWGNKIPIEIFIYWNKLIDEDILKIGEKFTIIWIRRRFSKYKNSSVGRNKTESRPLKKLYERGIKIENAFRELFPDKIITIDFENLIMYPCIELTRLCHILGVEFEDNMLDGTAHTGYGRYNKEKRFFDLNKL